MLKGVVKSLKSLQPMNFLILFVAGCINALGVTLFLTPLNLFDSGFSGTAIFLDRITPAFLTLSVFLVVLNFPLFIFGFKKLGANFAIYSLFAISIYSLASYLIQYIIPFDFSNGSPVTQNDLLLSAIFGGLLSGVGSGLTIRFGGALDGIEVLAVIFSKYIGITVGTFVMIYNVFLYVLAGFVFKDWTLPLYSIIAYAVGIKVVDFIVEGIDKAKFAFIITDHYEELAEGISKNYGRGVTIIQGEGFYSKEKKNILYVVVNRFEIVSLKRLIKKYDEKAFVTISEVSDMLGTCTKGTKASLRNKDKSGKPEKIVFHMNTEDVVYENDDNSTDIEINVNENMHATTDKEISEKLAVADNVASSEKATTTENCSDKNSTTESGLDERLDKIIEVE